MMQMNAPNDCLKTRWARDSHFLFCNCNRIEDETHFLLDCLSFSSRRAFFFDKHFTQFVGLGNSLHLRSPQFVTPLLPPSCPLIFVRLYTPIFFWKATFLFRSSFLFCFRRAAFLSLSFTSNSNVSFKIVRLASVHQALFEIWNTFLEELVRRILKAPHLSNPF